MLVHALCWAPGDRGFYTKKFIFYWEENLNVEVTYLKIENTVYRSR